MAAATAPNVLSSYVVGTKAWFADKDAGWISATLTRPVAVSATGEVTLEFAIDDTGTQRVVKTTVNKLNATKNVDEELPPLRNPPLLEATDDLTNLSYLNEPAGMSNPTSPMIVCCRSDPLPPTHAPPSPAHHP